VGIRSKGFFEEIDGEGADFVKGGGDGFVGREIVAGARDFYKANVVTRFFERGVEMFGLGDE
jgi:hypothetical protein